MDFKDSRVRFKFIFCVILVFACTIITKYISRKELDNVIIRESEVATQDQQVLEESFLNKKLLISEMLLEWENICLREHAILFKPPRALSQEKNILKKAEKIDQVSHLAILLLVILVISLARAAFDMSNQLKQQRLQAKEDEASRRCSLHDYALKHKVFRAPLMKSATEDSGTAITPAKAPWRHVPLQRRCSVPALKYVSSPLIAKNRRTSMDSFSEDESSPELKRRVRMIHRH